MTNTTPQFSTDYNKGFRITFENGMTISIQFGTGNYCSRRNFDSRPFMEMKEYIVTSPDAEIGIWDANGYWFIFGSDEVKGFVTPDEVALWIHIVSSAESLNHLQELAEEVGLVEKLLNQK